MEWQQYIRQQRVIMTFMAFLALANAYTMRISLSVAMTMIVKPVGDAGASVSETDEERYDWTQEQQGRIFSAFFWGYAIMHVPGGYLAEKFGGKHTLSLGILSTALFSVITPVIIREAGITGLFVVRFMMGLGEGTTFPAMSAMLASWVPQNERSRLGAFAFGGIMFGTIVGNGLSGVLVHNWGWPSVFYVFGGISIVWYIVFIFMCYSTPDSHPFISIEEKEFLRETLALSKSHSKTPPAPWRSILTSVPVITLIIAQIGHDWGFYIMVSDLPKYMNDVMSVNVKANGYYTALPYVAMWIVSVYAGYATDVMLKKKVWSVTNARKILTMIASAGPGIFILAASYAGTDLALVVILFTIAMGFMGCYYPGMKVNILDLAPNYSASLMGVVNGIGSLTGVAAPWSVGLLTPNTTLEEWRLVFWICLVVFVVTGGIYCMFASGEVQPWNEIKRKEAHEDIKVKLSLPTDIKSSKI